MLEVQELEDKLVDMENKFFPLSLIQFIILLLALGGKQVQFVMVVSLQEKVRLPLSL